VLRIPAVIDRGVQQGIAQVIAPLWEPSFSPNSYAYRPNRGAQDAVLAAQHCLEHGLPWAAKIDIENFFDSIPHNRLLLKLGTRVNAPRLLTLIELFLSSACCRLDKEDPVEMGAPQGSPLSPLLSSVLFDDFDKFLEAQEIRFVRYADDCMAFAASEPEAVTILRKAGEFLTGKLGLKLNQAKSRAVPPGRITFLGFALLQGDGNSIYRDISQENIMQFRARIEQLARFTPGRSFDEMIREVSSFVRGWCAYYGIIQRPWRLNQLRSHARLAARRYLWKSWATPENRMRELVARGVPADAASELSKEEYPAAPLQHPAMAEAIPNAFFEGVGLANVKFSRPHTAPRPPVPARPPTPIHSFRLRRLPISSIRCRSLNPAPAQKQPPLRFRIPRRRGAVSIVAFASPSGGFSISISHIATHLRGNRRNRFQNESLSGNRGIDCAAGIRTSLGVFQCHCRKARRGTPH
jgi:group II intron reverse transcriptase/maturase